MTTDALDPCQDGDGFAGAGEAIDHCRIIQRLFVSLDQLSLIFAQDAEAFHSFVVENPNTVGGHKLQDAVIDICINCLGGIVNNALDPLGELIASELVLEDVESIGFWVCPLLGPWLLASPWLFIERGMPSLAGAARLCGFHVGPDSMGLKCVRLNLQLVPQHLSEGVQLGDCFLPCTATFLDISIALHLCDENIVSTLVGDETALVNLSDDAWAATNHPDAMEANYFDSGNILTTLFHCINHFFLSLLSQHLIWIPAQLKGWGNENHV